MQSPRHQKHQNMFNKIFRSKSLSLPKIRFGKREKEKRTQSLEYTSLQSAEFKWQLSAGDDLEIHSEVAVENPSDVTFLAPHIFVVADSEGHKLDVFDLTRPDGEKHCGSIAEKQIWPNCVAKYTNDDNKVLLTDRKDRMVKVYDVERGVLLSAFGSPWGDDDIPYWPHGITMTSRKEIVITETSKHCVHVYNKHGKLQHTFGKQGTLIEDFCLPFYCSVDGNDRILISDNLNYSLKMYTTKGRQVAYMGEGRQENPHKKLGCPYGVCADYSGHVIACDNEQNRIVQYDLATAEYEREIVSKSVGLFMSAGVRRSAEMAIPEYKSEIFTKTDGCTAPCGIAVGPCGTMVFTECTRGHSSIKAYSLYSVDSNCTDV